MGRDRSAVRAPDDEALAATFPLDHYKLVAGADGEKSCTYEVRPFIHMGADGIAHPEDLSVPWQRLAQGFLSSAYRAALSSLTGCNATRF